MSQAEVLTYLTDATELPPEGSRPNVGDKLELRRGPKGAVLEAWLPAGQRLGRLPPEESAALTRWVGPAGFGRPRVTAEIAAFVPRPLGRGSDRIHIRVKAG